jgi:hypothetical protein
MIRPAHALLISILVAACSGTFSHAPREVARAAAYATFLPDGKSIAITVVDPEPIDRAELIAPDGAVYPAGNIERSGARDAEAGFNPHIGLVGGGGPRSGNDVGVGISLPAFGWGNDRGTLQSRATVAVPDMATYRVTWQLWQIRVRLGKPGQGAAYVTIPAPEPPA